ncbi:hypothetical protein ACK3SF_04460 [Candidatus Nanosalina sp. VS9-1]|uniref:hypothetical protein n=1 Tax=Candidatus Nanosalina sp. VS9-1 TaxID=3388566 RepID=UPI0039DF8395
MHPAAKILVGALMIVVGAFLSIGPLSEQVATLVLGGVGPLLVLIGAFIVWLESDEWKMERQNKESKQKTSGLQEQLKTAQSIRDREKKEREDQKRQEQQRQQKNRKIQRDYTDVLEETVEEAKETVSNMEDPNYNALIAAERRDKNRKTLIQWLERQSE